MNKIESVNERQCPACNSTEYSICDRIIICDNCMLEYGVEQEIKKQDAPGKVVEMNPKSSKK